MYIVNVIVYIYFISFVFDYDVWKIYWINIGYDIIECLNFDGSGYVEIVLEWIGFLKDLEIDINNG